LAREQRRLAAILTADVVSYSRLMGRDESGTLLRLKAHRTERLEPALARNGGRLVKLTGDGALAEFGSAVDALRAAIEFQQAVADANHDQLEATAIAFRMGLHLGDVIVDGDDLYGDAVNVADRLETEAPPGGIVVSDAVREAVAGRLKATFVDRGGLALKNIERPIHAFGVNWELADWPIPQKPDNGLVSAARRADRKRRILWAAAALGFVMLAAAGYRTFAPQPAATVAELNELKADDLERLLAERRTADAAIAEKKRLEEEARARAEAESASARQAEAAVKKAEEDRQEAEADLAKLKAEIAAGRQAGAADQRQLAGSAARRAAEEEAQHKAEVEMAALRQTEAEAQRKAMSDAESKRKADEALAMAQGERQKAETEASTKAKAALASGIVVLQSNFSAAVTVQRFEDAIQRPRENKILMLQEIRKIDLGAEAEKVGLKWIPQVVMEFGNPAYSASSVYVAPTAALDADTIKVVVWQDPQEKVWLAYNSAEWWAKIRSRQKSTPIQMLDEYQRVMSDAAKAATHRQPPRAPVGVETAPAVPKSPVGGRRYLRIAWTPS
jgi:class 3 adenylate cyclase/uncharacterized protein (DUF302 family)